MGYLVHVVEEHLARSLVRKEDHLAAAVSAVQVLAVGGEWWSEVLGHSIAAAAVERVERRRAGHCTAVVVASAADQTEGTVGSLHASLSGHHYGGISV